MTPDIHQLYDVSEATWPPARSWQEGPWICRDGAAGGKRVSAASALGPVSDDDIDLAANAMTGNGQTPLFQIREGEEKLDALLEARGYRRFDESILYTIPIDTLMDKPIPRVTAFTIWEPLAIMAEIWAAGGVDPARLEVMGRAKVKTGILTRWNEKPAAVGFAAVHKGICMVHAVEVAPPHRQQGVAQWIMRAAAFWGHEKGAAHLSVICVADNLPGNALYHRLGFKEVGRYHYRIAE